MQSRTACLTVWNYTHDPSSVPFDDEVIRYAVWQREKCPDTGKQHLQMYAEAAKPLTLKQWKRAVGDEKAHVEKRRGTREQAIEYCKKKESRDEETFHEFGEFRVAQGRRSDLDAKKERMAVILSAMLKYPTINCFVMSDDYREHAIEYVMNERVLQQLWWNERTNEAKKRKREWWQDKPLYVWQQEVVDLCRGPPDDRYILWLWSPEGNRGKSRVCEYLRVFFDAIELGGKADGCRFAYNGEPIVIFDISASQQEYCSGLYPLAEQLKNGCVFSSKYMSAEKVFVPPHVVFMANFSAPRDAWKEDRVIELRVPASDSDRCIKTVF